MLRDLILAGPIDIIEAVEYGKIERLRTLLHEDPEALNRPFERYGIFPLYAEGWFTPLAFAIAQGQYEVARTLLALGADRTLHSPVGRTLLDLAEESAQPAIRNLLREPPA